MLSRICLDEHLRRELDASLAAIERAGGRVAVEMYYGSGFIYGGAETEGEAILWRVPAPPRKPLGEAETVLLPRSEIAELGWETLIRDAVAEGAWG